MAIHTGSPLPTTSLPRLKRSFFPKPQQATFEWQQMFKCTTKDATSCKCSLSNVAMAKQRTHPPLHLEMGPEPCIASHMNFVVKMTLRWIYNLTAMEDPIPCAAGTPCNVGKFTLPKISL